jgi:para-nitrobenzyl esterase
LRALSPEIAIRTHHAEVSALSSASWQPFIDGAVIPEQPEAAIAAGRHHAVPFAIGANADETASSVPAIPTVEAYEAMVRAQLPASIADAALAQYPASAYPTPRAAYVRLSTDLRFVCPSREIAETADTAQTEPVFRYFFQYDDPSPLGAVHGLDVPFVFGTFSAILAGGSPYQPTATDLAVSADVQRLWTELARTGTATGWPEYDGATDPTLVIDATLSTATGIRTADCDFWEPFYDAL